MVIDRRQLQRAGRQWHRVFTRLLPLVGVALYILLPGLSRLAVADGESKTDAAALEEIFGGTVIASNVRAIRSRAAAMPAEERFNDLLKAILPASVTGEVRMAGEFTQAGPAPVGTLAGGEVVSPVYDLLDVARETGRLVELRDRVESLPESADGFQQRARAALRLLVNLELGEQAAAEAAAGELLRLVSASSPTTIAGLWPEMLAVYRGVHHHREAPVIPDLLTAIYMRRSQSAPVPGIDVWHTHLSALLHLQSTLLSDLHPLTTDDVHGMWRPVSRCVAQSRGIGFPQAVWMRSEVELQHVSGHNMDYLLYRSPLRGNYEVETDVYGPAVTQFMVAGRVLGMAAGGKGVIEGTFRDGTTVRPVEPHWETKDPWVRYRAVVRNGLLTVSLNGREVHSEPLPEHYDPWIGVHSGARSYARMRDIRITGSPEVPESVTLSALPDLRGWLSYHGESVNVDGAVWRWEADAENSGQIIARDDSMTGTFAESLLRYQRPLIEDGSIAYDFFYEPGESEAHPALDRLAFLLRPDGVSLHWITDSPYDSSGIGPENSFEEPRNRRGPPQLPLRPGEWNRMRISCVGATVSLELNGVLIYERPLESTNRRTFGLFRYADRELRVRNVEMRGDWPRSVPTPADQEFADRTVAAIEAGLPQLAQRFDHEFSRDGFPEQFFQSPRGKPAPLVTPGGLVHTEWSTNDAWSYSQIHPTVEMHGDFDVTLQFGDLQTTSVNAGCGLGLFVGDKHMELIRRRGEPLVERVLTTFVTPTPSGGTRRHGEYLPTEVHAGTFRIVRRGDTVSTLFADNDSTAFRIVGQHTWENCRELPATLDIRTMAHADGQTQVTWKRFQVAAERLMRIPTERSKPVVFTMNADGSEVQQLTHPMPQFVWHASPEWSPDGEHIIFDAWTGSAETSHIYIMNVDGSNLTDLGTGIIPSFSPDGRRIAFTWGGHGTTIMNIDGSGREVLTPEGWGCQWSPDGRWIAYGTYSGELTLIDVNTRETRQLLEGEQAGRYTHIQWNMAWSPDSRQIIFKGDRRDGPEAAIVSVEGSATEFRVITTENVSGDFDWHEDGRHILLGKGGKLQIYDVETGQFQLVAGQPMDAGNGGPFWDPEGARIVFTSTPKPEPVPW